MELLDAPPGRYDTIRRTLTADDSDCDPDALARDMTTEAAIARAPHYTGMVTDDDISKAGISTSEAIRVTQLHAVIALAKAIEGLNRQAPAKA